jgi:hypothetical protein
MYSPEQALPASDHLEQESIMKVTNPTQFPQLMIELAKLKHFFDFIP